MNKVITTHLDSEAYFPLHKAYYNMLQQIGITNGLTENYFNVLSPDCAPSHLKVTECRKHEWVKFYIAALTASYAIEALPDIRSCETLNVTLT